MLEKDAGLHVPSPGLFTPLKFNAPVQPAR
jgi:hypothetical protein